jgi:tagaturonate reductase
MILSKKIIQSDVLGKALSGNMNNIFSLPEKVLQFGTGVLLRALPDYFIDKANKHGFLNGRIVVVKSTGKGDDSLFENQDNLYTVCTRGIVNGKQSNENIVCNSISRVINANTHWKEVLRCAANPEMKIIISNTTEKGIELVAEPVLQNPPLSFPAKLTAFLYERFKIFGGSVESGMIIIPTELIPGNADLLCKYVFELAHLNKLPFEFLEWLEQHNHFCNSLVDRIVPGLPDAAFKTSIENELGYQDDLMIIAEPYHLWAIQGDDYIKSQLSFVMADEGVIIEPDIETYRELKLRLLNGTHTLCCSLALLYGIKTVKEAMNNVEMAFYIKSLMLEEIAIAIPYPVSEKLVSEFINSTLDRFRNPFIEHKWTSITAQYSTKMKMRCIPVLLEYCRLFNAVPQLFAKGFAAYLLFMRTEKSEDGSYFKTQNKSSYSVTDDKVAYYFKLWQKLPVDELVLQVLQNSELWGTDLSLLPGFYEAVAASVNELAVMEKEIVQSQTAQQITDETKGN